MNSPPHFQVHAYPLALRLVGSLALSVCGANLLFLAAVVVAPIFTGMGDPPLSGLATWLVLGSLVPLGLARLIRWSCAATLQVEPAQLVLQRRRVRFEIPRASIDSLRPWWVPLPGAGLTLRMKSGRSFHYRLQLPDPQPLLESLGKEDSLAAAARHPSVAFAQARHALVRTRWYHLAFKFVLFPLLPTLLFFRAHQYITFGGPFGQYQMYGLGPYLKSLAGYWGTFIVQLLLFASVLRGVGELVALGGAWLSPPHARGMRRVVEIACRLLYYVGFPALFISRFFL
jgi:hypothetical protein